MIGCLVLTENVNLNPGCLSGIQWAMSAQSVSAADKCLCFWTRFTSFVNGAPGASAPEQTPGLLGYLAPQREANGGGSLCGRTSRDREHCQPHLVSYVISNTVHGTKKEEKLTERIAVVINEVVPSTPPPPPTRHQTMSDGCGGEGLMRTRADREPHPPHTHPSQPPATSLACCHCV